MTKKYDAIVIGSGQAGTPLCKKLAEAGLKTALIEKRWVGGTCVNDGCSPTKAMVASAKAAWGARQSGHLGIFAAGVTVDIQKVIERQKEIVLRMRSNVEESMAETKNLDVLYGEAAFCGVKQIEVTFTDGKKQLLSAEKIFVNTGLKPKIPDIPGIGDIEYLTSTSLLDLKEIPEKLLVVGSGYIGLEFGQMYQRFGSAVTIIEGSERIMLREDTDIAEEMTKILTDEGLDIQINTKVVSFANSKDGIVARLKSGTKVSERTYTHVLLATGRVPNTAVLKPEASEIKTDEKGFIIVNDQLETSVKGVYALGDVKGGPAFTHVSYDDYRIVAGNLLHNAHRKTSDRILPYCMFTDPQLGRVGITQQEAEKQKLKVKIATLPNSWVARSIETGDTRGMMKAIVDKETGKILGAAVLSNEGGEVIAVLQMAMLGGITWEQLRDSMFAHPTYSESLNNLFMNLDE
ncbi:putative pyridine nucleotide-disulfide oxidoreductase RclA [Dyadobacter sp. CECT 9275]|uniref:Pyridine nucleotide-disulfide oxidoreductase RclA n=1 Tax=Dyadobacter helix TaxID=2822344 RepID=A0A916JHN6_9BACT|nr:mercuric reductase [Dyadobacter sp. CECT 9275]CAG5017355.1 putative pyridine nucleotide-disulfide oxidoreductase RclA [Dyadobacter sp. CECT 9275]